MKPEAEKSIREELLDALFDASLHELSSIDDAYQYLVTIGRIKDGQDSTIIKTDWTEAYCMFNDPEIFYDYSR